MRVQKMTFEVEHLCLLILSGILFVGVLWSVLMAVVVLPDDWDAWAQWGPKAKLLAVSSGPLSHVQYFVPGSGDYPLLWPAIWAFSGWSAGGWEDQWSTGWGPLFMALTAWQLSTIHRNAGGNRIGGLFFAALFVSMPAVLLVSSWGYAEAPLWLMLTCAMTELIAWGRLGERIRLLRASVFIAAAASTKNEGMLFALICLFWVVMYRRNIKDAFAVFTVPLLVMGLWRVYTIVAVPTSNHALRGISQMGSLIGSWQTVLRYAFTYVSRHWADVRQWNIVVFAALVASIWLFIRGGRQHRMNLIIPFLMVGGLLCVVLLYGENWKWQMHVAWNRLTIQFMVLLLSVIAASFGRSTET